MGIIYLFIYLFIYLPALLDTGLPGGNEHKQDLGPMRGQVPSLPYPIPQPVKVGHTTGVLDPNSFRIVMWVFFTSHKNKSVKVL